MNPPPDPPPSRVPVFHAPEDLNQHETITPVSFTKDIQEAAAVTCQRPNCESGRHFPPGTQLWFVASKGTGEGRYVCRGCHEYYAGKQRASSRGIAFTQANVSGTSHMAHPQSGYSVQKLVAAGQRGDKSLAHVQAIGSNFFGSQFQGQSSSNGYSGGPIVRIPGRGGVGIGQLANTFPPPMPGITPPLQRHANETGARCAVPANIGYNIQHMLYHDRREQAAKLVYAGGQGNSGHLVVIRFWIALQPAKPNGSPQPVEGITETISDVDVHIGANALKALAWEQLRPVWERYADGFPLSPDLLTLRDQHWARIDPKTPDVDAIAAPFFKQDKKKPTPPGQDPVKKFDAGKGATVYLHLPPEIHRALEDYLEERALQRLQGPSSTSSVSSVFNVQMRHKPECHQTNSQTNGSFAKVISSVREPKSIASMVPSKRSHGTPGLGDVGDNSESSDQHSTGRKVARLNTEEVSKPMDASAEHLGPPTIKKTSERHPLPSKSANNGSVPNPLADPLKSSHTHSHVNHDALFLALLKQQMPSAAGVKPLFNLKTIVVQARAVLHFPDVDALAELSTSIASLDYLGEPISGQLMLDTSASATKHGAFKRAQFGKLYTDEPLFESLPASSNRVASQGTDIGLPTTASLSSINIPAISVCAKQAVYPTPHGNSEHPIPHIAQQQGKLLMTEVQCLVWAQALLKLAYDFVEEQDNLLGSIAMVVPKMHFVDAALAIVDGTDSKHPTAYLIEQSIPVPTSGVKWRKYINNDSPKPIPQYDVMENERAQFLAFTQHVQMWKTRGLAIVTDYQGYGALLSDPQINTNPRLGNLFASGNLPNLHHTFVDKHKCTKFCNAYKLPSIPKLSKLLDEWNAELDPPPPSVESDLSPIPSTQDQDEAP
ncbi:hypothetical protein C8Q79DRAFT_1104724 [Trametes meyenii]|nr:hypothetical protein C8Q79DRAFT_1104724 [Trametes meyenii]